MGARLHPSSKGGRGTREDARRTSEGGGTTGAISNLRGRDASVQFTERGRIASALPTAPRYGGASRPARRCVESKGRRGGAQARGGSRKITRGGQQDNKLRKMSEA